jgi:hypothetical protein
MTINNSTNVIDSRDVIRRIWELTEMAVEDESAADVTEREALLELEQQCESVCGGSWVDGITLILDDHFDEYVSGRPAARRHADYQSVDFDGVTYWIRR